jgi:hypothetical protein
MGILRKNCVDIYKFPRLQSHKTISKKTYTKNEFGLTRSFVQILWSQQV